MINIKNINVTCLMQHARVLWSDETKEALVVDPGGMSNEIVDFIKNNKLKLEKILLTHSHFDHCGGVSYILKHFKDAKLFGAENEKNFRQGVKEMMFAVQIFDETCENSPEPHVFLEDSMQISLGKEKFIALATPGHTQGGFSFYNENNKILISGDTLFRGSVGRTDFIGGNYEAILKSIKEKLFVLPDDTIVYPGHGGNTTIKNEKLTNPYFI